MYTAETFSLYKKQTHPSGINKKKKKKEYLH